MFRHVMTINAGHKSDKMGKHEIIFMNVSKHIHDGEFWSKYYLTFNHDVI